jgi:hypothetical protein
MEFMYSSHSPLDVNQTAPSNLLLALTVRPCIPEVVDRISPGISNTLAEDQQDALFTFSFIPIYNLYMFRAVSLLETCRGYLSE